MVALIFVGGCVFMGLAYVFYGRFLERELEVDDAKETPAHTLYDNMDYVPTATPILFGHHFSSIAGAGPIVGPVIAGLAFGWGPALLWILLGSVFIGGVHDFTSLIASIRHRGRSIGQLCKDLLNPFAYYLFLIFIWFTLMYVLIVFLDLTALSFAPVPVAAGPASDAIMLQARQGGAVATASIFYIVLAILFGLSIYKLKVHISVATVVFVSLVFAGLWFGNRFPLSAQNIPPFLGSVKNTWNLVLIVYCFGASILPVWILLQPRDYLSSFLLYSSLLGGAVGLVVSGFMGKVAINYPAFIMVNDPQLGFIFPTLFVTVACGAVSGFHSIVASGTTAKQLDRESSALKVGYGSMLVEGCLALLALAAVMMLTRKSSDQPVAVFAQGLAQFLSVFGLKSSIAVTFGMLAVSTFLLTTLDTCTRLCRFIFEELFNLRGPLARYLGTFAALLVPSIMVFREIPGPGGKLMPAWKAIWPAFGAANQLLAALALLVVYAWLKRSGRRAWYVLIPMVFMCATTITALSQLVLQNLLGRGSLLIGAVSLVLDLLAIALVIDTYLHVRRRRA